MLTDSNLLQHRAVKFFPHVVDTVLLVSGLSIAIIFYGAFYHQSWLLLKLFALLVYIVVGSFALTYGKTKKIRIIAFVLARGVFFFIITLSITHALYPLTGSS